MLAACLPRLVTAVRRTSAAGPSSSIVVSRSLCNYGNVLGCARVRAARQRRLPLGRDTEMGREGGVASETSIAFIASIASIASPGAPVSHTLYCHVPSCPVLSCPTYARHRRESTIPWCRALCTYNKQVAISWKYYFPLPSLLPGILACREVRGWMIVSTDLATWRPTGLLHCC